MAEERPSVIRQLAVGELRRDQFAVTVEQQGGNEFVFGFGEIGNGGHGKFFCSTVQQQIRSG